jgi:hypothetical protein
MQLLNHADCCVPAQRLSSSANDRQKPEKGSKPSCSPKLREVLELLLFLAPQKTDSHPVITRTDSKLHMLLKIWKS